MRETAIVIWVLISILFCIVGVLLERDAAKGLRQNRELRERQQAKQATASKLDRDS